MNIASQTIAASVSPQLLYPFYRLTLCYYTALNKELVSRKDYDDYSKYINEAHGSRK